MANIMITKTVETGTVQTPVFPRPRALDLHASASAGWMPVGAGVPAHVRGSAAAAVAGLRGTDLSVAGPRTVAAGVAAATPTTETTNSIPATITATEGPPRGTRR